MIQTLIIISMAMQGHWFGGRSYDIEVAWAAAVDRPDARLHWELIAADQVVAQARHTLTTEPLTLSVELPKVRRITPMIWQWAVYPDDRPGREAITSGAVALTVYPDAILADLPTLLDGATVGVLGDEALLKQLEARGIDARQLSTDMLDFASERLIIAGPDALKKLSPDLNPLSKLLASGKRIIIFAQSHPAAVGPLSTTVQLPPDRWAIYPDSPLPSVLLEAWTLMESPMPVQAAQAPVVLLQCPADRGVTPLRFQPPLPGTRQMRSVIAQTAMHRGPQGSLIWTQQRFGPWQNDPRAQWMLMRAIGLALDDSLATPDFNQFLKTQFRAPDMPSTPAP